MSESALCPCHSEQLYTDCCEPFHTGTAYPSSALQLMRSRYSAYALRLVHYLVKTTHPDKAKSSLQRNLMQSVHNITWTNLTIIKTSAGTADDKVGKVSFEATYMEAGREYSMVEHSRFRKRDGKWYYYDGKG